MTRHHEKAQDFGLKYFSNGFKEQIVYRIYENDIMIKECLSTKFNYVLFATIQFNSVDMIVEINFHENKNKKFRIWKKSILVSVD
jgi:hypothetical protein